MVPGSRLIQASSTLYFHFQDTGVVFYKTTSFYQDTEVSGFLSLSDFRGSDGVHIFATSLLFGPTVLSFSFFHDSE